MDTLDKTRAIVIKTIRYGDSSIIVKLLTEKDGLRSFLVKSVFNKNAKIRAALFQPLTLLDIVSSRSRGDIGFLKEASVNYPYKSIPFEINKNAIIMFVSELLSKSMQDSDTDTELFDFVFNSLEHLDETADSCADFPLKFSIELSRYLGFSPNIENYRKGCCFNLEDGCFHENATGLLYLIDYQLAEKFYRLCCSNISDDTNFEMRNSERRALLDSMMTYYKLHVAGFNEIKSCDILRVVLS